jgi:hypothetical protein
VIHKDLNSKKSNLVRIYLFIAKLSYYNYKVTILLEKYEWEELLEPERCTPFIGPEAYAKWLPSCIDTVSSWAGEFRYPLVLEEFEKYYKTAREKYGYPLEDSHLLAKVAQFLAIEKGNDLLPKSILGKQLKNIKPPDFSLPEYQNTPYAVLAELDLPIYITTNYDHFMEAALLKRGKRPVSEFCRWNERLVKYTEQSGIPSVFDKDQKYEPNEDDGVHLEYRPTTLPYKPSPAEPLVYHLHGIFEIPYSMVLTEKDYFDFAISLAKIGPGETFPPRVRKAFTGSLLFIGYRLEDITFRVIFQALTATQEVEIPRPICVAVQLPPKSLGKAQDYLNKYTKNMFKVNVCWGGLEEFLIELRQQWNDFKRKRIS